MITSSLIIGAAPLLATKSKSSSGGSSSSLTFIIIILLVVAVYFFFLRPRQQRAKAQTAKGKTLGIGDEVMSVGGIFGRVVDLSDDESVDVEVAPGIVMTFLRRAVNPRPPSGLRNARSSSSVTDSDEPDHPYGGSRPVATSFGASSGHFDDSRDENRGEDADDEDFEEDEDFDEVEDFDEGESSDEEVEGSDGEVAEAGDARDNGRRHDDHGSSGGSATGTPRTTGGSRAEED